MADEKTVKDKYMKLMPVLTERSKRLWAATGIIKGVRCIFYVCPLIFLFLSYCSFKEFLSTISPLPPPQADFHNRQSTQKSMLIRTTTRQLLVFSAWYWNPAALTTVEIRRYGLFWILCFGHSDLFRPGAPGSDLVLRICLRPSGRAKLIPVNPCLKTKIPLTSNPLPCIIPIELIQTE